jgi:hypothetical protein
VECAGTPKKVPKHSKGDGSNTEVDGDRQTSRGHALLPALGNHMIQGWSQSSDLDKDKSFSMLIDWIPEGDGLLEAEALRKRVQDEWGCVVTTPPHMTAKKGKLRAAVLDTLGYTEIMGPIFDAGI